MGDSFTIHLLVEEGAKVENVSRYSPIISQGGDGINLNKYDSNFFVSVFMSIFVNIAEDFFLTIIYIRS